MAGEKEEQEKYEIVARDICLSHFECSSFSPTTAFTVPTVTYNL